MSTKNAYEKKMAAKIDQWNAKIDEMSAKAKKANADVRVDYYKAVEEIKEKRDQLESELLELKNSSSDAWEDVKVGVEKASINLDHAMERVSKRFFD